MVSLGVGIDLPILCDWGRLAASHFHCCGGTSKTGLGGVYLIFPVTVQVLILQGTTQDAADNLFNPLGWGNMRYTCAYYSTIFLLLQSSGVVDVNFNRAKKFVQHFSVNDTTQNNQATNGSLNPASWCRSGVHSD